MTCYSTGCYAIAFIELNNQGCYEVSLHRIERKNQVTGPIKTSENCGEKNDVK